MDTNRIQLGVWLAPSLGEAWGGELKRILQRLYGERVAGVQWIPRDWLARQRKLQDANPTALVRIGPATLIGGARAAEAPEFADTPAKLRWWQELFDLANAAVAKYSAGQAAAGKAELDRLYADAEFWNTGVGAGLIATQQTLRNLPETIAEKTGDVADKVVGGVFRGLFKSWVVWVLLAGAAGFAAWKYGWLKRKRRA